MKVKVELTAAQQKKIRSISKRVRRALEEAQDLCRELGFEPEIYVESEGPTIHLMDYNHPNWTGPGGSDGRLGARTDAIVFSLPDDLPFRSDVGAW